MSLHPSYHADSDADDEYERSVITSPHLTMEFETSPTDSNISSAEHTPTKFGHPSDGPRSPRTIITEWSIEECQEFLTSLGLLQYHGTFRGKQAICQINQSPVSNHNMSRREWNCRRSAYCPEARGVERNGYQQCGASPDDFEECI